MGPVVVDSNLLLLLVTGSAKRDYITKHKNLSGYGQDDFDLLAQALTLFSDIVLLPHVLAEASSLARQIRNPARRAIQDRLKTLVETTPELYVPNIGAVGREEYGELGLTDAVLLQLGALDRTGAAATLLTADNGLAVRAEMLGHAVLNFGHLRA